MSVTVISCLYGRTHTRFLHEWLGAVGQLDPPPQEIILSTDRARFVPQVNAVQHRMNGGWRYPQAYYLTKALGHVMTDWVWIHDIDDIAFPDALEGIDEVEADVWQMGYESSNGESYLPPQLTGEELLAAERNPFVGASCVRTAALRRIGGFPDVAQQDWTLWRVLAREGISFAASGRTHFNYRRHADARCERELNRASELLEMAAWEELGAVSV